MQNQVAESVSEKKEKNTLGNFIVAIRRYMFGDNSRITVPIDKYEQVKACLGITDTDTTQTGGYPLNLLIDGVLVDGSCYIKKNSESNVTIMYSTEQQNKLKEIFTYTYDMISWNSDDKSEYEKIEVEIIDNKTINFKCFPILPEIEQLAGNKKTFEKICLEYCKDFDEILWKDSAEKYKWNHLVWFKKHWDIDASDFPGMLREAFKLAGNLLDSGQSHLPLTGIIKIATEEPETARKMFIKLFDESIDIIERIQSFMNTADECYSKYYGTNKHDQNSNAISVYLWSRYPEKYYIYKYQEIKAVAKMLGSSYSPTTSSKKLIESCLNGFKFYDAINYYVNKNEDLRNILKTHLQESNMPVDIDRTLHTLTIDIGYYMANYMWSPKEKEYNPKLDVKAWKKLLLDETVFDSKALKIIRRMEESGGSASCVELSLRYGLDANFYNKNSTELAKKICEKSGCKAYIKKDKDGKETIKHWPVLFVGRNAGSTEEGYYIWKLRDELLLALEDENVKKRMDSVALYEDGYPTTISNLRIWKVSHGNDDFGDERKNIFERQAAVLHLGCTGIVNHAKVKGKSGMSMFLPGDFIYICYSNDVRVLGRICDASWEPCPEKNENPEAPEWFEIKYEVVKDSIKNRYDGVQKSWSPNYRGTTYALVPEEEQRLFEKELLIKHFDLTIEDLNELKGGAYVEPHIDGEGVVLQAEFDFNNMKYSRNTIVFGAPGTGKSYCLEEQLGIIYKEIKNSEEYYERVTFHPEYNYFKFVGSYRPKEIERNGEKVITYSFVPGPFIKLLVKALNNPKMPFVLLIEEINRANVAAVFGDIFQLLDRDDEGNSLYSVSISEELENYLKEHLTTELKSGKIRIPSNMYIWATMNSADQGVFPMDTAFKRRWEFEYIGIDDEAGNIPDTKFEVAGYSYKWNDLRRAINGVLTDLNVNEDKLMGPFFLSKKMLADKSEKASSNFIKAFKSKVLMYLFEDAAKQKRKDIFGVQNLRYSDICKAFDEKGIKCFGEKIIAKYKGIDTQFESIEEKTSEIDSEK